MLNMTVGISKANFFDRKAVSDRIDPAAKAALSKFGAFVRTTAIQSIRTSKTTSRPGKPPSSHVGTYRKLIFFAFDAPKKAVVIGPALLRPGSRVPALLEYGGEGPPKRGASGAMRPTRYRARPHMGPAFQRELSKAPGLWANSIK